ncbi:MAG: PqqD family protein [Ruminococcaceae bacterium]|nr:PqqD family protein [Oscillospiraceae bacterium]
MYKLNEQKMFYDMAEGQAIVINFTTGMYYGTSSLGSAVLDALVAGAEPAQILTAVQALPDCPADMAEQLDAFIAALLEKEIIVAAEGGAAAMPEIGAASLQDGFVLSVDEFSEVQDLILADPVHDVDVEMGWPILNEQ